LTGKKINKNKVFAQKKIYISMSLKFWRWFLAFVFYKKIGAHP